MIFSSLRVKVGVYLVLALSLAVLLFTLLVVRNNRDELRKQVISHAAQLSEVVIKSTRFAMLQNQPAHVDKIIQDVGDQKDIDRVRILSKDGKVIHSSVAEEIGNMVDQEAESCLACHEDEQSKQTSPMFGRPRFFTNIHGERMLGSTAVIHNEPTCSAAGCHASQAEQSVLGVLDIVYPMSQIDSEIRSTTITIVILALGFVILAAILVSLLVQRAVYRPLADLKDGAARLAQGDLEKQIPVRSKDEFGHLAESFNSMTDALRKSRVELEEWGHTLEQKVKDATHELQLAQAEAARGEKLASVGLLAAGIAHELNNPLTGVLTFSHLVRKQMPDGSPEAEDLDLVIKETKRCAVIIRRLLDFAREKTPEKKFSDLNHLVEQTAQLIKQSAQIAEIDVILDLDPSLPEVWIDEDLVKQVIMNLLVNAQHATDRGGSVTVRTRVNTPQHATEEEAASQPMAEVTVTDTGCGIPEENLQRIFDPFFTTKGVGKGTGLGLSVSHGTIAAHGGTIEVDSEMGAGAEFRIYLPLGANSKEEKRNEE
ncbi:MAG: HAMP domain-containing protein [Xanthomonadales bacterium]|nr:HAMP domain-containing protein [Gammaproteobacteria bacterium]MBT8052461.1 HAMP domain-containing protein [Gammaproteobacteria bacterium]NND57165.1 HAMP domain-containing protein [Xanthomonadales bacterium]NNK52815.1 HAMP domain-containing protein [Xanthomonadales bacterium]